MSEYKEFQGKTLDEAIRAACTHFDTPREKLEIEIVSDAKAGIFGLVGVRKASIKARRVHFETLLETLEETAPTPAVKDPDPQAAEPAPQLEKVLAAKQAERAPGRGKKPQPKEAKAEQPAAQDGKAGQDRGRRDAKAKEKPEAGASKGKSAGGGRGEKRQASSSSPASKPVLKAAPQPRPLAAEVEDGGDELPRIPMEQLDQALLEATAREVVTRLVDSMLDNSRCEVVCASDRVRVSVSTDDNSGLLIGKDGQTLASLQYLAARMVSNKMGALVRVHVDAGDYRERQDERLRDLALDLAAKVKANNRPQLTRPLTSYQRRVIHVTLQDDPLVQTHSKGEGELKRVVITLRRRQDKQGE